MLREGGIHRSGPSISFRRLDANRAEDPGFGSVACYLQFQGDQVHYASGR